MSAICLCGQNCENYEAWIEHVRKGAPIIRRPPKTRMAQLEMDRAMLVNHIEKHRLAQSDTLSTERKNIT